MNDGPALVPFIVFFVCFVLLVLVVASKFFPLMDIEKRRREGISYDDLLEKKLPGKLFWTVMIGVPILVVIASWVL